MIDTLYPYFKIDSLNSFIIPFIVLFGILNILYSFKFMSAYKNKFSYYANMLLTLISALGCVLANNLILLIIFWGFLGLTLYILINASGTNAAAAAAKKTFIIIGASDAFMILGVVLIYWLTKTLEMDKIKLAVNLNLFNWDAVSVAWLCLAIASFAKAGLMPLHSWIPDCAREAPIPVTAFLPASLDKLLGIYLLARMSMNIFVLNRVANGILMLLGAFTILAAVMMALIQHDFKKLLGYHAVSQVGYMVLGIGTGTIIGIAGGLFHMINNAIYKSCLFLSCGAVEYRTKSSELDNLGGLARYMPITFLGCLIASFSISGVPPFNGFVSKWLIYQGLIELLPSSKFLSTFCLAIAMFGSGLTLASFMKLLHAIFLGQPTKEISEARIKDTSLQEVSWPMWLPVIILAGLCLIFGVFAYSLPLNRFIYPAVGKFSIMGDYAPGAATLFILLGILLGLGIYGFGRLKKNIRPDSYFVGGENIPVENKVPGTEFYHTIKEFKILKDLYRKAEAGFFDIYEQGKNLVFGIGRVFQYLHNGILPSYLVWTLLGLLGLFVILFK